jgi:hypothetical protein
MSTSVVVNRIYGRNPLGATERMGRICAEDFVDLWPDLLLLRGLKPLTKTQTAGGLELPDGMGSIRDAVGTEDASHPVRACAAFEVVRVASILTKGNPLDLKPGDVVLCFNAAVDPLLGNELAITNINIGVQAVLERTQREQPTG